MYKTVPNLPSSPSEIVVRGLLDRTRWVYKNIDHVVYDPSSEKYKFVPCNAGRRELKNKPGYAQMRRLMLNEKQRLIKAANAAAQPQPIVVHPVHQGKKECERRVRQMRAMPLHQLRNVMKDEAEVQKFIQIGGGHE